MLHFLVWANYEQAAAVGWAADSAAATEVAAAVGWAADSAAAAEVAAEAGLVAAAGSGMLCTHKPEVLSRTVTLQAKMKRRCCHEKQTCM